MVGRKEDYKASRIRQSIYGPLEEKANEEGFVGGFSPYVESLCLRYIKGILVDRKLVEQEIREQIYAELAADGIIIPPQTKYERNRKTG